MRSFSHSLSVATLALLVLLQPACSDNDLNGRNPQPDYLPVSQATVELPPDEGSIFLLTTTFDLTDVGYRQSEFFLSGTANAFTNSSELGSDGRWQVEAAETADYKTRVVVYRPIDPEQFSGTVIIEWLNVTAGFENPPNWGAAHTEILRAGHAWVGLSAQRVGIEGSPNAIAPFHLKAVNPARYGSLSHPGDSFSYDILSQTAQALRKPGNIDLLDGLGPDQFIATGQSQSAGRLMTFINAIQPLYGIFDGFLVQSRGDGSSPLAQDPQIPIPAPESVIVRTDLTVPVLNLQAETDVVFLGSVNDRQPDNDHFRLWEVAGTSHSDHYTNVVGRQDIGTDPRFAVVVEEKSVLGFLECDAPMNAGPLPWVTNAAVRALDNWIRNGELPPTADRLAVTDDLAGYDEDELGNALGGIRTPYLDAPAALLNGDPQEGDRFCFLFGGTRLFDAAQMASLYVDKAGYMQAVSDAADDAFEKGFLLAPDVERIKAAAGLQWDLLGI